MTDRTEQPGPDSRGRYHHGDLQRALIAAAEAILAERGLEGFTLREAARQAGVSAAAPAHHFGSAAGLLTAVAVQGFDLLARYLREGTAEGGDDPAARLRGQGMGYVRFAQAHPALFQLMFRRGAVQRDDEKLHQAGQGTFGLLEDAVRAYRGIAPGLPLDQAATITVMAAWSTVHGFAHLALEGKFERMEGGDALLPDLLMALWP